MPDPTRLAPCGLAPCGLATPPTCRLQALPRDARPVTSWPNQDEAFADIARALREAAGK